MWYFGNRGKITRIGESSITTLWFSNQMFTLINWSRWVIIVLRSWFRRKRKIVGGVKFPFEFRAQLSDLPSAGKLRQMALRGYIRPKLIESQKKQQTVKNVNFPTRPSPRNHNFSLHLSFWYRLGHYHRRSADEMSKQRF